MNRSQLRAQGLVLVSSLLWVLCAAAQSARTQDHLPKGPMAPMRESPFIPNAVLTEGFDLVTSGCIAGWNCQNLSSPVGSTGWFQGDATFPAQAGAATAYIATNFNNTTGDNTISNWLITPQVNFASGAQLRFWTRTLNGNFPDRLEVRVSSNGASTNVGATNTSVGDFTTTLTTINPSLTAGAGICPPGAGAYPIAYCEIVLGNAQGIPTSGSGRIAFRYFVTNGGPTGANSNFIGIDTFSYDDTQGSPVLTPLENFDGLTPPALASGWTATSNTAANWVSATPGVPAAATSPNVMAVPADVFLTDAALTSIPYVVSALPASLSFARSHNVLENGFDGMVLELSVNGGAFVDAVAAGGFFSAGGYNGTINTGFMSALAGRNAWTGDLASFVTSTYQLPASATVGSNVAFRWRMATDATVPSGVVQIDSVAGSNLGSGTEVIYGMTGASAGANLVRFPANAPASVTTVGTLTGVVAGHALRAIDFRPANGQLYALSTNTNSGFQLYTVNLATAVLTPVGAGGTVATAFPPTVSMDFNPTADRLRVVTGDVAGSGFAAARSYRINPNDGALVAEDTALSYVAGDPNVGNNPPVPTGAAYDRNDNNPATPTTMFLWDFRRDTLSRVGSPDGAPTSPNSGQLTTIFTQPSFLAGNAGLGFDVGASGTAYLSYVAFVANAPDARTLNGTGGPETFARLNLTSGAVTVVGQFPAGVNVLDISAQLPLPAAAADLVAALSDSPDPVTAGTNLSYTATATNGGASPAAAVSLSLTLPTGTTFVTASPSVDGVCTGTNPVVCSWTAATAPGAGNARSAAIVAAVPSNTPNGTVLNATVTVATSTADPNLGNNTATQTTTVGSPSADIAITLTDAPDPVTAGTNLTYQANLSNAGPNDAQNVSFNLTLPPGTSFVSVSPSAGGICNALSPVVCTWSGPTIPANVRSATIVASVGLAQSANLSATANTGTATADPNPGNNSFTATTTVLSSTNLPPTAEAEPNNGFATATALSLSSGWAQGNHAITPGADLDFWSIALTSGQRVWIATDTGGTQLAGANSRDTAIDLLAPDGTTVIENDDDDGTGTGGDGTVESANASAIAGRAISATGTHFISVRAFSAADIINPLSIFVARTSAADQTAEVEGNDSAASANAIATGIRVRTGSIGVAGDRDFYQLTAAAGDILYYAADADPERDGTGTDLVLELRAADGTTILQSIDSSATGTLTNPAAESSRFNVLTAGTYFLVARHANTGTGSYHLMLANGPATETVYGITGSNGAVSLVRFAANAPASVTTIGALTGVIAGHAVRAIDFRPANGQLYALSTNASTAYQLYTVNLTTAALTPVGPIGTVSTAIPPTVSMDFNPAADRLRVVTGDADGGGFAAARSYRINPNDGSLVAEDTALTYVAGDPNVANNPPVPTGAAYDRNDNNPATPTTMYIWDFRFDTLARVGSADGVPNSPNTGQLTTILSQPVFLTANIGLGFDVGGGGVAYLSHVAPTPAQPTVRGVDGTGGPEVFSRVNLGTGVVSAIGGFPAGLNMLDISVQLPIPGPTEQIFRNGFENPP